ncbi:phosphate-starvation-inducible PsiE family protein [Dokdonella sp.]|uniref:phosphate-starvation-inducible protein PsiE n=1 Tax=Dokdonella sp. TaxID=2291710 RepID=UPI001B16912E|nr:phosphate-starvation-inducible PsiE family protein [Dokdonella sp.]MBO9663921.1 phosphate-starvation-inducible PsiE family protein [Dokdonella sp.]
MSELPGPGLKRGGLRLIGLIEHAGLIVVLIATVVAAAQEIFAMWSHRQVGVTDLLLLFIYLEIVTMSAVYWRVGRLPVRMPLYIAMVAMARHMTLETQDFSPATILAQAVAILLLGIAVLVVRYGHVRFPYTDEGERERLS